MANFQADAQRGPSFDLDPRMKLLVVLIFTTSLLTAKNLFILGCIYITILILFLIRKAWKTAGKYTWVFSFFIALELVIPLLPHNKVMAILGMIFFLFERMIAAYAIVYWMADGLKISDFVTALRKMHIPKGGTISFAVIFRFIPTVKEEFRSIKNTMTLRGIGFSAKNVFLHPFRTTEYVIVPLLLRSLTIADELAASAMTRGLDLDTERTSYNNVRLCWKDFFYTFLILISAFLGQIITYILNSNILTGGK